MNNKQFNSLFVPELLVDIPNHIVELILINKLEYQKKDKPKCAFWRKDIAATNSKYLTLQKDYIVELQYVKKLLMVFSPQVVINTVKNKKQITLGYLKTKNRETFVYELFQKQIDLVKEIKEKQETLEEKSSNLVTQVENKTTIKNKFSGIL